MSDRQVHLRLDSTVDDSRFASIYLYSPFSRTSSCDIFRDVAVSVDEKQESEDVVPVLQPTD